MTGRDTTLAAGTLTRLQNRLFGFDVFISYAHENLGYALALEKRLTEADLRCFRDTSEMPAGTELEATIKRAVARSRRLVAVATADAGPQQSPWVTKEIALFTGERRDVLFVNFLGDAGKDLWPALHDRVWIDESPQALEPPKPSDTVIDGIAQSVTFWRCNRLARIALALTFFVLLGLATGLGGFWVRSEHDRAARLQAETASRARQLVARAEASLDQSPALLPRSALLAALALSLDPAVDADRALRRNLAILPPLLASLPIECAPRHVARSADGRFLAVAGLASGSIVDRVCLFDLEARRQTAVFPLAGMTAKIALSPDGQLLAAADDKVLRIWRTADRQALGTTGIPSYAEKIEFSPDGQFLAIAGQDGVARILEIPSLRPVGSLRHADSGSVAGISFSPDGRLLVITWEKVLRIWEGWSSERPRQVLAETFGTGEVPFGSGPPVAFSADGRIFAWGGRGEAHVLSLPDLVTRQVIHQPRIDLLDLTEDGMRLVAYTHGGMVQVWNVATAKPEGLAVLPAATLQSLGGLFFTPGGDHFVTFSLDGTVRVWELESGREVARMTHNSQLIQAAYFDRQQTRLVTVGSDQTLRFWGEIRDREREVREEQFVGVLAWSGDGLFFASFTQSPAELTLGRNGSLSIRESDRAVLARSLPARGVLDLRFSANGEDLLAVTRGGISLWRNWRSPGSQLKEVHAFLENAVAAAFNDEATVLAIVHAGGKAGILRGPVWDWESVILFNPSRLGGTEPWSTGVAVSRTGRRAAIALSGAIVLLDVEHGRQEEPPIPIFYRPHRVAFSPDERTLALAGSLQPKESYRKPIPALEIYALEDRSRTLRELLPGDGEPFDVEFSRDGTRVAVAGPAVTQVWRLPAAGQAAVLMSEVHPASAYCRFTPAGDRLLTAGGRLVRLSLLSSNDLIAEAVHRVGAPRPGPAGRSLPPPHRRPPGREPGTGPRASSRRPPPRSPG